MAETINFEVIQGDTFVLDITYRDSSKNPVNMTGYTATFKVKDSPSGKVTCAVATTNDGIEIDELNGKVHVELTSEQTKKFTIPKAAYQLQITSPIGIKETLVSGWLSVSKAVI